MSEPLPYEQRVMAEVDALAESFLAQIKPQLEDQTWGSHSLNDQEFMTWFQGMMRVDPFWAQALWFVQGGRDELHRYSRMMGGA